MEEEHEPSLPTKQNHRQSRRKSSISIGDFHCSIIKQILEFLPVKDAIKLCSLSRHWLFLWKSIVNLSFHCESFQSKEVSQFVSFVDKFLMVYPPSKIKRFSLKIYYNRSLRKKTESWLRFATSRKVEELCLDFTPRDSACDLGRNIWWTSLKILSLTKISFGNESIQAILLGTPLMESLTLRESVVYGSECWIDASGTSLKELVIDGCRGSVFRQLNISAPGLLSLTVEGVFRKIMLKLIDVSSVKEATINLKRNNHEKEMLKGLLEKLSHVNRLTIGIESLQVLSMMRLDGKIIPTSRWKSLKVEMKLYKRFQPGMEALLDSSPYLEQFIMNVSPDVCNTIFRMKQSVEDNYWRWNFSCLNNNLRRVEVIGFVRGDPRGSRNQIMVETMNFVLDTAKVLQNLIVHARTK